MTDKLLDVSTLAASPPRDRALFERELVLTLLAHPDSKRVGERARPLAGAPHARVAVSRAEPLFHAPGERGEPLLCPFVSRKPLWLQGRGELGVELDASECGSRVEVDGVHLTGRLAIDSGRLEAGAVVQIGTHIVVLVHRETPVEARDVEHGIVGDGESIREVRAQIGRLAAEAGSGSVLVRGETGSGKELVAHALHRASARRAGPFVAVNMAAIPPTLAASELFGHARGAFSGADQPHDGYFVAADGGTLFLDEVGDTPPEVQAALLRVLESGDIQPVGKRQARKVDVRVVAATDVDLEAAVSDGRFRAPLLYRLSTSEIRLPPLRERRADIGRLAIHFLGRALAETGREALLKPPLTEEHNWLPAGVIARLARYDWPGNVRQLRSVCLGLARTSGEQLRPDDPDLERLMPKAERPAPRPTEAPLAGLPPRAIAPDEVERVLMAVDYRLGAAAEWLGISRPSMNELVDKHPRLRRAQRLEADEIRAALAEAERSRRPAWRVLEVSERGLQRRMKELGLT